VSPVLTHGAMTREYRPFGPCRSHLVAVQQALQLSPKLLLSVVLLLVQDVGDESLFGVLAHRERGVARLPREQTMA